MKKIFKLSVAAFAIVAAASCAKEFNEVNVPQEEDSPISLRKVEMTFTAVLDDTKGVVDGNLVKWEVGDSLKVYDDKGIAAYIKDKKVTAAGTISPYYDKFYVISVDGTSAVVKGDVYEGATQFLAVYPFTAASGVFTVMKESTVVASDSVIVNVPDIQMIPAGRKVDPAALVAVSKASKGDNFSFTNVFSLLQFTVSKDNVSTVVFQGKPGENFLGTAKTSAQNAVVATGVTGTSDRLSINNELGKYFAKGDYYAAVLPATLPSGITFGCTNSEISYAKSSTKAVTFKRNGGMTFGKVDDGTALVSEIKTYDDLVKFAEASTFYGATSVVKLAADIDCGAPAKQWSTPNTIFQGTFDGQNHKIYNIATTSETAFAGLFGAVGIGKEYAPACVKNLCVGSSDYNFDTKKGTYDGKSKFTIATKDPSSTKAYAYAGIVGLLNGGTMENVTNFAEVEANSECTSIHMGAGVAGALNGTSSVENCANHGAITDNSGKLPDSAPMGGVIGWSNGTNCKIAKCNNYGDVTVNGIYTNSDGGVIGRIHGSASVEDCENHGALNINIAKSSITSGTYYGGITGYSAGAATFKDCKNYGKIICKDVFANGIGGIVGCANNAKTEFDGCENCVDLDFTVIVSGKHVNFGGIVGNCLVAKSLKGCKNNGALCVKPATKITTNTYFGGIIGNTGTAASGLLVSDCHNYKNLTLEPGAEVGLSTNTGGIIGYHCAPLSSVEGCTNEGDLYKQGKGQRTFIGGIIGNVNAGNKGNSFVKNCTNKGSIMTESVDNTFGYIAGIVGWSGYNVWINYENCTNNGEVSVIGAIGKKAVEGNNYFGVSGIIGYLHGAQSKVIGCVNNGKITPCTTNETENVALYVGGIVAKTANGTLEKCINKGEIYCDPGSNKMVMKVGGVLPGCDPVTAVKGCANTGKITLMNCAEGAGSIVGSFAGMLNPAYPYSGANIACGEIIVNVSNDKLYVGGLCATNGQNKAADKVIAEGSIVDVKITVPEAVKPNTGMVIGAWRTDDEKKITIGSAGNPVKVMGSLNGTAVTKDNLASLAVGSSFKADTLHFVNAALCTKENGTTEKFDNLSGYNW